MDFLDSLNSAQKEAATYITNSLLILAGAGSGKTKTLTSRLAYLLCKVGIPPQNTLTLTFTNKAAKEMRERAIALIQNTQDSNAYITSTPLLCTFHKFGLLFLQRYIHLLKRSPSFTVIDEDDKRKILRDIKKTMPKDACILSPSSLSEKISEYKNNGLSPLHNQQDSLLKNSASSSLDNTESLEILTIYQQYEHYLTRNNLIDFDDLLLLPYKILHNNEHLKTTMSEKYQYIMVDEYQDTNDLQVALLKQLCTTHNNICVVGDDDQSIYSWRGANIRNILEFNKDFHDAKIIKLEHNYRSTRQILDIANNLISHNLDRHNKTLKPIKPDGNEVRFFNNRDDKEEMTRIIESIHDFIKQGSEYEDIAILFRLNGLANNIESFLNKAKIPFQMIGTFRLYERQEIKDVIAYLRLALNMNDNFSFMRIINRPKRGIGEKTLQNLLHLSGNNGIYHSFCNGVFDNLKCKTKLQSFFEIIKSLQDVIATNIKEIFHIFQTQIKLYNDDNKEFDKESENSNEERRQYIEVFFAQLDEFIEDTIHTMNTAKTITGQTIIQDFLNDVALSSSNEKENSNGIKCMSVHNSKGLEFKHVFVVGLEEGFFPLHQHEEAGFELSTKSRIFLAEEERRLAYVAFTRAKDNLILSYAKSRLYRNQRRNNCEPSIFLIESGLISPNDINKQQAYNNMSHNYSSQMQKDSTTFQKGDCVQHKIFGFGRIESVQGSGAAMQATINFGGMKRTIQTSFLSKI